MADVRFLLTGDTSLCAEFGNEISEKINTEIRAFNILLNKSGIRGIVETVPTYRSLMIHYDPEIISYRTLMSRLKGLTKQLDSAELPPSEVLEIPVLYGGEMGPDLDFVAEHAGISKEEVVKVHTSVPYLIYMLGFTPGFTYLGGMSDKIETPRLKQPHSSASRPVHPVRVHRPGGIRPDCRRRGCRRLQVPQVPLRKT